MKKKELIEILGRTASSDSEKEKIADIKNMLLAFDEETEILGLTSIEDFKRFADMRDSDLSPGYSRIQALNEVGREIKTWVTSKQKEATCNYRKVKKGQIIIGICVLGALAICALIFGIMGALIDNGVWKNVGDIIGAFDCAFGIGFFAYELYDDKLKTSEIERGNAEVIKRFLHVEKRNIWSFGNRNINIVGNINVGSEQKKIIDKKQ